MTQKVTLSDLAESGVAVGLSAGRTVGVQRVIPAKVLYWDGAEVARESGTATVFLANPDHLRPLEKIVTKARASLASLTTAFALGFRFCPSYLWSELETMVESAQRAHEDAAMMAAERMRETRSEWVEACRESFRIRFHDTDMENRVVDWAGTQPLPNAGDFYLKLDAVSVGAPSASVAGASASVYGDSVAEQAVAAMIDEPRKELLARIENFGVAQVTTKTCDSLRAFVANRRRINQFLGDSGVARALKILEDSLGPLSMEVGVVSDQGGVRSDTYQEKWKEVLRQVKARVSDEIKRSAAQAGAEVRGSILKSGRRALV